MKHSQVVNKADNSNAPPACTRELGIPSSTLTPNTLKRVLTVR